MSSWQRRQVAKLHLDTDLDLDETFGDPCPGMRKKLVIR